LTSAATFAVGAAMPLAMVLLAPAASLVWAVSAASLLFLAFLGAIGAKAGGANVMRATWRVTFWGPWRWGSPQESARWSVRPCERCWRRASDQQLTFDRER
jgi:hypothetical protein